VAEGRSEPTNDFERSVGDVLQAKGFEVVFQLGVAGFFLDIALRHPAKPGAYLLGVECDGATYHSGRSARDRDRLRQEILESHGWKIHRIWSTDWFQARNSEIERMLKHIDDLLQRDPDYQRDTVREQRDALLRDHLLELRRTEIEPAFPNSPVETCLLRDPMLDEFLKRRPRTRQEWFLFPFDLRSKTDPRQVGQYLEKVFTIIDAVYE
jgi:very-short-patch-repair endonuclease